MGEVIYKEKKIELAGIRHHDNRQSKLRVKQNFQIIQERKGEPRNYKLSFSYEGYRKIVLNMQ